MPTVVVDASIVVELVLLRDITAPLEDRLHSSDLVAPDLLDVEVVNTLRRLDLLGHLAPDQGKWAMERLYEAPIERYSNRGLVTVAWELRHNVTAMDAVYVGLARVLDAPLVTLDRRLVGAPNLGITLTVVA
jgi:predicted nucleic acid-binding protein